MMDNLKPFVEVFTPVGSRITCNPPVFNTDEDWLVYVHPDKWGDFEEQLIQDDWSFDGSDIHDAADVTASSAFSSIKKGNINLIATSNKEFHSKFLTATHVAKKLNLLNKDDRILLFQAVLYANSYEKDKYNVL